MSEVPLFPQPHAQMPGQVGSPPFERLGLGPWFGLTRFGFELRLGLESHDSGFNV